MGIVYSDFNFISHCLCSIEETFSIAPKSYADRAHELYKMDTHYLTPSLTL